MDISELQIDDKTVDLIVLGLAREVHEFAVSRGVTGGTIEGQLRLVFSVLDSHLGDLLNVRDVPTRDATCLAAVHISLSNEGYRLLAGAAKDRVANLVN